MSPAVRAAVSAALAGDDDVTLAADDGVGIGIAADDATAAADGSTVRLGDGRDYTVSQDPATGHTLLDHRSEQTGANGNRLQLHISIDLAPDRSFTRTIDQALTDVAGNTQTESTTASYDTAGAQTAERTISRTVAGVKTTDEDTSTTFAAGQPVRRATEYNRVESQVGPGQKNESAIAIHATWENGGQPISETTVPQLTRVERGRYEQDGMGINKDTSRVISTELSSHGTPQALTFDGPMKLVVRFNGHGDQYIERELTVPVNAEGTPDMARAEEVSNVDNQSVATKALTQGRIWGGFASSLGVIIGSRMLGGNLGGVGRSVMWAGMAAGVASLAGESHALLTKRNDGSGARLFMSVYDNAWTGLVLYYTRGRSTAQQKDAASMAAFPAASAGLMTRAAGEGAGLIGFGRLQELRAGTLSASNRELAETIGMALPGGAAEPSWATQEWRAEPRFDAGRSLAPAL